jgi:tight adherence protein C
MTSLSLVGAALGALAAAGLVMSLRAAPPMRPVRLVERVAPYLGDAPMPSKLLARPTATTAPFVIVRRLFGPSAADLVRLVDRVAGGSASVRRRLRGLGSSMTVEEFRFEQIVWAAVCAVGAGIVAALLGLLRGDVDPVLVAGAGLIGLVGGVFGRDWWLSHQLARREAAMLAEFPVIADLLALAVVAGEAPADALVRVCRLTGGELAIDITTAMARARSGVPLVRSLAELAETTTLEPFSRFVDGMVVAIERGTPLAEVLRAQAADVREITKRALLESGGRKEITMMMPVVFLILPVTVVFALYPGLLTLVSLTK